MSTFTFSRSDIWYRKFVVWKRQYARCIGGPHITLVLLLVAFFLYRIPNESGSTRPSDVTNLQQRAERIRNPSRPSAVKGAVVLLAPQRHAYSLWEIDRFCFLRRAIRSIDQHLNAHYGPYPILILVAKDHSQDPQRQDGPYTEKDRASVEQWAPHSTITWHEINMYSGDALEPNVTVENILAWRKGKNGGIEGRSLGYQSMCRLWSGRLQNMPGILDDFDFYMRMDDDSLLVDKPEVDPFQHFQNDANLSYAYRRKMSDHWGIDELWRVARPYVMDPKISSSNADMRHEFLQSVAAEYESNDSEDNNHNPVFTYTGQQPYNNFHVSRVNFWRLPSWQALMKDMDANHLFFKHRVGDANVHAMALMMMGDRKSEQWYHFPYAHNSNDMGMQWGTREWKTECEGPDH